MINKNKTWQRKFSRVRCIHYIIVTLGIMWIMMNGWNGEICEAASFQTNTVYGVMSTAVKDNVVITWEPLKNADGYRLYEAEGKNKYRLVCQTKNCKVILRKKEKGITYRYYVKAYKQSGNTKVYSKISKKVSTTVPERGKSTIKNFLQTAIAPMGTTMYVWGGGWNKEDTAAGREARRTGLSSSWRKFAKGKTSSYDYKNYRYQIHDGLDCSGYVGWCVYNVMNTKNDQEGYVLSASNQAKAFARMGMGTYRSASKITDYKPGDIMSSTCSCCGHVWIVIGQCDDGSVVLVHASPPGVQICGTTTPEGAKNSQAYALAKKYMKKYYKSWYNKHPDVSRNVSYLSHYGQMRWTVRGRDCVLSDPDHYRKMSAEEVLADLFSIVN
ncbi:MAG: hypothetical protein IJP29_01920 [Lachnospiraceae bacterium]|nr:hypothetical protein [Lachnospiraceae bacterium]